MNPSSAKGSAWGLMQVIESVRKGYNRRMDTNYSRNDLLNADINIEIAVDLLHRIIVAYGKHPDSNMQVNWDNPEFVKLLVAGWNSGYSEAGGVGKVAKYLEARGIPVTHNSVFAHSEEAGATRHLRNDRKQRWQAGVVSAYFNERKAVGTEAPIESAIVADAGKPPPRISAPKIAFSILGFLGFGWFVSRYDK